MSPGTKRHKEIGVTKLTPRQHSALRSIHEQMKPINQFHTLSVNGLINRGLAYQFKNYLVITVTGRMYIESGKRPLQRRIS